MAGCLLRLSVASAVRAAGQDDAAAPEAVDVAARGLRGLLLCPPRLHAGAERRRRQWLKQHGVSVQLHVVCQAESKRDFR